MCVYIAVIAMTLQVTLLHVDSAPALKCNSNGLASWLAGHLEKGRVHWRGGSACACTGWCTLGLKIFLIDY